MLERLLELLRAGGTWRPADLARELGATPALVEMMLDDLCRWGYVTRLDSACAGGCASCTLASRCLAGGFAVRA